MAVKTTLEQLEEVQTAITAVMASQSYTIGDRTYTFASLQSLEEREKRLLDRYNAEQTTKAGFMNKVKFGRPT